MAVDLLVPVVPITLEALGLVLGWDGDAASLSAPRPVSCESPAVVHLSALIFLLLFGDVAAVSARHGAFFPANLAVFVMRHAFVVAYTDRRLSA
jgi:hypothetical protein